MNAEHVDSMVDDYLHDLLTPDEASRVERHCAECAACREALEAARSRLAALRAVPPCEPSELLIQKTLSRLQSAPLIDKTADKDATMQPTIQPPAKSAQKRSPWHRRVWLTLACAASVAAIAIGATQRHWQNYKPLPYDLRILGQDQLLEGAPVNLRLAVFDRDKNRLEGNLPVTVALVNHQTHQVISETQVDTVADGPTYVSFDPPAGARGEFDLVVKAQTGTTEDEMLSQVVTIRRAVRLMLSCDKPVYQPGQTIHVRSLTLRRPDLKPVQAETATFTVFDTNGNAIFKRSMPTSKFGIAAADCQLATEILEGTYRIHCQVAGEFSERTVEVRKYVLPKFKVSLTLDKPFYQPGETISGTLDAAYFFGKPVAAGEVKLQLLTSDVQANVLEEKTEKTDAEGKLQFSFKLPDQLVGQEQTGGDATVRIAAQVTDTAGQSQATLTTRTVTSQAIHLSVIPEASRFVPGIQNKVYVFASYPDGQPVKNGKVTIGQKTAQTSEMGIATFELEGQKPDITFTLDISASDDTGRSIRQSMAFATGPALQDYIVRTDKPIYDGGETMNLEALGGGNEPVFIDLLKDGQSLLSKTIEMKDGRGELAIDLPAEISGAIELWSYRFLPSGVAERKSRLVLIRPAADLKITAALDRKEHRPGEKAQMNFQLTDASGRPVPGAISVAVVDEAVFSVLSQSSGLPQLFFMLDQELLQPVYAVYEQWSPPARGDVAEGVREEFDAAMFSLTSRTSSEPEAILRRFAQGDELPQAGVGSDGVMIEPMMFQEIKMPDQYMPGQMTTPFNLTAASYRGKALLAEQERQQGLRNTRIAWGAWTIAVCLGLVASVAIYAPRVFLWGAAGLGVLSFFAAAGIGVLWIVLPAEKFETLAKGAAEMAPMAMMAEAMPPDMMPLEGMLGGVGAAQGLDEGPEPIRVRSEFPETLLWLPELVTDDAGKVSLDIPLADSITTWRLSAAAVSGEGQLGSGEFPIRVFQPFFVDFNLPVALTRNDEAAIPIVVYNYLDAPQTVTLKLAEATWFQRMDGDPNAELTIELAPREIKSTSVRLKMLEVGRQQLEITARGGDVADAIRREIEVIPDGRRIEESYAGRIEGQVDYPIELPADRIPGSTKLIAKVYPATFTQLVEGLDSIFQMPHGCFEQTSSTTYPSVLALDYLKRMQKSSPAVEAKARQYIHIGYQRLVSFEVPGGGFDWFGRPPANRTLTAYGLMEFDDMARVHDVDPNLLERTRAWLLSQRQAGGTWAAEPHMLDDGLAGAVNRSGDLASLASTAYIAWAVFRDGKHADQVGGTLDFLVKHDPSQIEDPYILAVTLSAIAAIKPDHASIKTFADRLEGLKQRDPGKRHTWWDKPARSETMFCGEGETAHVETTAMAAIALMTAKEHKGSVQEALAWMTTKKVEGGTWGSTQATVLALQALLSGIDQAGDGKERRLELAIDGTVVQALVIAPDQFDVVQQIDLTKHIPSRDAANTTVSLRDKSNTAPAYQLALRYHVPGEPETMPQEPLTIKITYDRQQLAVNDRIAATATVTNNLDRPAPMVILDLPIPGGFVMEPGELEEIVGHAIERFQVTNRKAIVYLRDLPPGAPLELNYRLKATMPVKVTVPQAEAYQYYTPERRGKESEQRVFVVGDA